jgi:DNA polymerase I-like protein with 3'-5' exonuclease and polymerase domains
LEWRTALFLSGDKTGIQEVNNKEDTHSLNQIAFNLPSRLIAKKYLFRTIFRGSGYAFSIDPDFMDVSDDSDFWDDINRKFYLKYKGLDDWHKSLAKTVAQRQPIVTPFGREFLILPLDDGKLPWTIFVNYPVQGTGADLMLVARVSLHNRMRKLGLKSLLVSTVHDSIVVDCVPEEVSTVVELLYRVFDDLPKNIKKLFGANLLIPFPCEVKVGPNLATMSTVACPY